MAKMAKTIVFLAALAALAGCQVSLSPGEAVYQAVHIIDVAQTSQIAKEPTKHYEDQIQVMIGRHPSERAVLEWGLCTAIASYALDDYLYHSGHPMLAHAFESVQLAIVLPTVYHNFSVGLYGKF